MLAALLAASLTAADERACRRDAAALASEILSKSHTCAARCEDVRGQPVFAAGSAATAQAAREALTSACEQADLIVVAKTVSCLQSYSEASLREDLDADCARRKAALEAELTAPRLSCTARLVDESGASVETAVSAPNAAEAFRALSRHCDRNGLALKSFAPGSDCRRLP
jgi:hypothetical protein